MHEVYAGVRIWQLEYRQKLPKHARVVANRIFGAERWNAILDECGTPPSDEREHLMQLAFAILHTSGWDDDPNDQVRTMSNMEMSAIHYIDERLPYMDNWPIYVADEKEPLSLVGIELVFDVVLEYTDKKLIRHIGTIDGLCYFIPKKKYVLEENKTASRLDDAWRLSFDMSHQVTGYCAASTTVFGFEVLDARVFGAKIKPTGRGEDVYPVLVKRDLVAIQHWGTWVRRKVEEYEQYKDDFEHATRHTHSCNRYFRPCSLLSFCCDTPEGRQEQWEEMVPAEPSPSERAIQEL